MNATKPSRTLTVRPGFDRQSRRDLQATRQSGQPTAEKLPRQWSMQFETRCLLRVLGPAHGDTTGRKWSCMHVRGNGEELGTLCAVLPWDSTDVFVPGTLIEVGGLVATCSNGRYTPLVRLEISRWAPAV
jgi:hypothetical protein